MAHSLDNGVCTRSVLRTVLFVFGFCLVGYSIRPLWYWRLKEKATVQGSCPQCLCHCSSNNFFPMNSGYSLFLGSSYLVPFDMKIVIIFVQVTNEFYTTTQFNEVQVLVSFKKFS